MTLLILTLLLTCLGMLYCAWLLYQSFINKQALAAKKVSACESKITTLEQRSGKYILSLSEHSRNLLAELIAMRRRIKSIHEAAEAQRKNGNTKATNTLTEVIILGSDIPDQILLDIDKYLSFDASKVKNWETDVDTSIEVISKEIESHACAFKELGVEYSKLRRSTVAVMNDIRKLLVKQ